MKILLAADGSDHTRRAAQHLVKHIQWYGKRPEVHVLTVHAPIPYARAAAVAGADAVRNYHQEECEAALEVAGEVLRAAGVDYQSSWVAGEPGDEIAGYAQKNAIDLIVMGSHGHGQLRNLALGSVGDAVLRASKCPVMVVK
jgi:nucleotide-binding universal stress UspA family protein